MNRTPRDWVSSIAVGATALIVLLRIWFAFHIRFCGTPDSCSYLALGESLSSHRGFVENFLYQYQMVDLHLPAHGIEYWRPGTSFWFLLTQPFGGVTLHSSLIVTICAGIFLAAAAWKIAKTATGDRRIACACYLLCLVLPPLWINSLTPDSALFYGGFVAWFLALFTVESYSLFTDVLALVCLAMANLIRNDAILLLVPVLVILWLRWTRSRGTEKRSWTVTRSVLTLLAIFVAMLPVNLISYVVLGKFFTGHTSSTLYLLNLSDLDYYSQPSTLQTMLAAGVKQLVKIRVAAISMIVYRAVFLILGFAAIFLPVLSLRWKDESPSSQLPEWAGGLSLAGVIVGVYGLFLPAIGTFSALRAFTGLLPLAAVTIVVAIIRSCKSDKAAFLILSSVVLFYLIAGTMEDRRTLEGMNKIGDEDRLIGEYLKQHGASPAQSSLIMTADPAQFSETTSYPSIPVPSNGEQAIAKAVHDLRPTHILLDKDQMEEMGPDTLALFGASSATQVPHTHIVVLTLNGNHGHPDE